MRLLSKKLSRKIHKIKWWIRRHERLVSSIALIGGFVVDNITLQRIDLLFENIVLGSYLLIAGIAIVVSSLYHAGRIRGKYSEWVRILSLIALQFAFGGLFSGFLIFYTRSASIGASWFFLLVLVGLFLANEFLKGYFVRLSFQISLFFIALFSFAIYFVPILTKRIGAPIFLLSGVVSLLIIYGFLYILKLIVPEMIEGNKKIFIRSIGGIFIVINIFYFLNLIPPIPLSLKDVGIYHSVERRGEGYVVVDEVRPWWDFDLLYETINLSAGEPAYAFSSIFAPTNLSTTIIHEWLLFDEENRRWVSQSKITFPIVGGRENGYRVFSKREAIKLGFWRVDIKTPRGQIIGRVKFNVERSDEERILEEQIK